MQGSSTTKKDFDSDEWNEFCDALGSDRENIMAWNLYDGLFSESGYGDGSYEVYANDKRTAFTIVFINERED